MRFAVAALSGALLFAPAAFAQSSAQASARNPAGLVKLLESAGYSPTLGTDSTGDPSIDFDLGDYKTTVLFYDCDAETHDRCGSVQLRAGFDRDKPWTAAEAIELSRKYRFVSVWLDDEGDPWVQWDIMTEDGIPAKVFLSSVEVFGDTLEDVAGAVFDGD